MLAAGINVAFGHDDIMDPWYPLGTGNPVQVAFVGAHATQLTSPAEIAECFRMVTDRPAAVLGLGDDAALAWPCTASPSRAKAAVQASESPIMLPGTTCSPRTAAGTSARGSGVAAFHPARQGADPLTELAWSHGRRPAGAGSDAGRRGALCGASRHSRVAWHREEPLQISQTNLSAC